MTLNPGDIANPIVNEQFLLQIIEEFRNFISGPGVSNNLLAYFNTTGDIAQDFNKLLTKNNNKELDQIKKNYFSRIVEATGGSYAIGEMITNSSIFKIDNNSNNLNIEEYFNIVYEDIAGGKFPALLREHASGQTGDSQIQSVVSSIRPLGVNVLKTNKNDAQNASIVGSVGFTGKEQEAASKVQGYYSSKIDEASYVSTVHVNKSDTTKEDDAGAVSPKLGAFIFKDSSMNFSTRNNESQNIFFNALTPLEMSRCAPYINLMVLSTRKESSPNGLSNVSFMRFLKKDSNGNFVLDESIGLTNAKPIFDQKTGSPNTMQDLALGNVFKASNYSYMDIFTAPQTMANSNINGSSITNSLAGTMYEGQILDPILPFLTLESLSVNIAGLGYGLYSSKIANITLVLHDRSRLGDIKELIAPKEFGRTRMLIQFGWSHPDGGVNSNNLMGQFLNQMKDTGFYAVKSSNFSFSDGNTVKINLSLSCYGGDEVRSLTCGAGSKIPISIFREAITEEINNIAEVLGEGKKGSELKEVRHLMRIKQSDVSSASSMIEYDDYLTLMTKFKSVKDNASEVTKNPAAALSNRQAILNAVKDVLGLKSIETITDAKDLESKLEEQRETSRSLSASLVLGKTYALTTRSEKSNGKKEFSDGYLLAVQRDYSKSTNNTIPFAPKGGKKVKIPIGPLNSKFTDTSKYVSLGKVLMSFIGHSLSVTGMFDEVQMFFYPINSQAAGARGHTTASFPIDKDILQKEIQKQIFQNPNLTTKALFSLVINNIINNNGYEVYGISSVLNAYKKQTEKQDKEIKRITDELNKTDLDNLVAVKKIKQKELDDIMAVMKDKQKIKKSDISKICELIYNKDGGPGTEPKFVKPNLTMFIETVPMLTVTGDVNSKVGKKTIARVHIYDTNATSSPTSSLLNSMLREGKLGKVITNSEENPFNKIEKSGNTVFQNLRSKKISDKLTEVVLETHASKLKPFVKRGYPSITYGTSSGVVRSINISSNVSNQVAQVLMITAHSKNNTGQSSKGSENAIDEITVVPATLSLNILGMPMISRGSQIYIDFGTNTTLDNIYTVKSVKHSVKSGEFSTSVEMIYAGQGDINTLRNQLKNATKLIVEKLE